MYMQTLLTFLPLAQTSAPNGNPVNAILEQLRQQSQVDSGTAILAFIIGQVIAIIAILIASKAVVPDRYRTNIGNALRVWGIGWVVTILAAIAIVVLILALSAAQALQFAAIALLLVGLVTLFLWIRVPMATYDIRFFRSIGLLIIAFVVSILGQVAVSFVVGPPPAQQWALAQQIWKLTPQQRAELNQALQRERQAGVIAGPLLPGEKEARDPALPLQDRADALKKMYAELERRRLAIAPGDEAATAAYERQKARYEKLLDQLKAEAKKQRADETQ